MLDWVLPICGTRRHATIDIPGGILRISHFTFRYNLKESISERGLSWEATKPPWKAVYREKDKTSSFGRRKSEVADTRLKQHCTRCRHGISIEDRDGVLFLYHCKPTWAYELERSSWATDHGYLHKSGCSWCFIRRNLLPAGDEKERHEKELLTRSVRPYIKCTISPCTVTKKKERKNNGVERRLGAGDIIYKVKRNILFQVTPWHCNINLQVTYYVFIMLLIRWGLYSVSILIDGFGKA